MRKLLIGVLLFLTAPARAQEPLHDLDQSRTYSGPPLSLSAALQEAQDKNPELIALRRQFESTRFRSAEQRFLSPPMLEAQIWQWPINTLNRNEQGSLQQSALNITSGFVAGRIANSVSGALGLDSLGVDIREVDFSGGKVGFGRYVGSKTYVSASQQVSREHGRDLSVAYEIAPDWKLGTTTSSKGSAGIDIIWHKRY